MISIITCSPDSHFAKYEQMANCYQNSLIGESFEIIRIPDAINMAEGYNKGILRATGDTIVFSHNDAAPLRPGFGSRLRHHLRTYDIIGGAGADRLVGPKWFEAGPPHTFGQVLNVMPPQKHLGIMVNYDSVMKKFTITAIGPGTPFSEAGVPIGSEIRSLNGMPMLAPEDFVKFMNVFDKGQIIADCGPEKCWTVQFPKGAFVQQPYNLSIFGVPGNDITGDICVMDGFIMACRRDAITEEKPFDDVTCDTFHMYDVDWSWRQYRKGRKLAIAHDLFLGHASTGGYNDPLWKTTADKWMLKWGSILHKAEPAFTQTTGNSFFFHNLPSAIWFMEELTLQGSR